MFRFAAAFAALSVSLVAVPAQAQEELGPEHQRLHYWVGEWTYEVADAGGTFVAEAFGDGRFIEWQERYVPPSGDTTEIRHVFGYDPNTKLYFWHRYMPNGSVQTYLGWVRDNKWTFLFDQGAGRRIRLTSVEESPTKTTFTWARSDQGGPWEVTAEGTSIKVK